MCFLNYEIRGALLTVQQVYDKYGLEPVCTAGADGNHKVNSKHYVNDAIDLRLPPKSIVDNIIEDLKARLGNKFYVLLEVDHIHIQWGLPK